MALGQKVRSGEQVTGFRAEIARRAGDSDAFFTFFDGAADEEEAFIRGAWDFSIHIAALLNGLVHAPKEKTALEIGYGGGRLLAAAARHFRHAIGVDVHGETALVRDALARRGIDNVTLHQTDGRHIPLADAAVDVVYSFIVFQHMDAIEVVEDNITEACRCLRPGGVAVFYVGRMSRLSYNNSSRLRLWLDRLIERLPIGAPYRCVEARVNETSLMISNRHLQSRMRAAGFEILRSDVSRRSVPDAGQLYGGQSCVVARKPG